MGLHRVMSVPKNCTWISHNKKICTWIIRIILYICFGELYCIYDSDCCFLGVINEISENTYFTTLKILIGALSTPLSQIIAPCFFFLCSWVHMYVCIHVLVKQLVKFHAFGICDDLNEQ